MAAVAAAAQPYVFEHAGRLAQELFDFAALGRSIAAHDLATGMAGAVTACSAVCTWGLWETCTVIDSMMMLDLAITTCNLPGLPVLSRRRHVLWQ